MRLVRSANRCRFVWALAILPVLLLAACGEEDEVEMTVESFSGTYAVGHASIVGEKRDSVILIVTNGREYTVDNYPSVTGGNTQICSSAGGISGFGTSRAVFTPRSKFGSNCDTTRVPSGEFVADFRSHGDTVYLDRTSSDSTYSFRLLPE